MPNDARDERGRLRSKVLQYPDAVLDLMDEELSRGRGAAACMKIAKTRYDGPLVVPSRDTFESYVKARRPQLNAAVEKRLVAEARLSSLPVIPDLRRVVADGDTGKMMGAILALQAERVEVVRELQGSLSDPRYEQILVDTLTKMSAVLEKKLQMEAAGGMQRERLQAITGVLLRHISSAVSAAYKDIHGDAKLDVFVGALERHISRLDFGILEDEVLTAVTSEKRVLNLKEGL